MKLIKRIGIEFTDGTKQVIDLNDMTWINYLQDMTVQTLTETKKEKSPVKTSEKSPVTPPKTVVELDYLNGIVAVVTQVDKPRKGRNGGEYRKCHLTDMRNGNEYYVDINNYSNQVFQDIKVDDIYEDLRLYKDKPRALDGKSKANKIGNLSYITIR